MVIKLTSHIYRLCENILLLRSGAIVLWSKPAVFRCITECCWGQQHIHTRFIHLLEIIADQAPHFLRLEEEAFIIPVQKYRTQTYLLHSHRCRWISELTTNILWAREQVKKENDTGLMITKRGIIKKKKRKYLEGCRGMLPWKNFESPVQFEAFWRQIWRNLAHKNS